MRFHSLGSSSRRMTFKKRRIRKCAKWIRRQRHRSQITLVAMAVTCATEAVPFPCFEGEYNVSRDVGSGQKAEAFHALCIKDAI